MAVARWSGQSPFGSDNDEYRLLAHTVWRGSAEIAGVEGTKYPVGYSAGLGLFDLFGFSTTKVAIAFNLLLVIVLSAVVWALVPRRYGPIARSAAVSLVVSSVTLWDAVYSVMPDVAIVTVSALVLWWVTREDHRRYMPVLLALVAAAALLKSVGVLIAVSASLALLARPKHRRVAWMPAATGIALAAAQSLWAGIYPDHTTGYARTFWLVDPFNLASGHVGVLDLPSRIVHRFQFFRADVRTAVMGVHTSTAGLTLLTFVLIAIAVLAVSKWRCYAVPFVILYAIFLSAWPFSSGRFGLVLLPYAAVGAGIAIGFVSEHTKPVVVAAATLFLLVPHVAAARTEVSRRSHTEAATYSSYEAGISQAQQWLTDNVPSEEKLASFDYRELAYRTDRIYLPLGYTVDHDALWEASYGRGARWLVVLPDLYGIRTTVANGFLQSRPDRISLAADFGYAKIYRLEG